MPCRAPRDTTICSGTQTGAQLSYDTKGWLATWQNAPSNPTSTDGFLYDGEGHRIEQQLTSGGTTTTVVYVGSVEEVSTTGSSTTTTTYYSANGQRLALAVNGVFSYLGSDGLGSAEVALNANGNVQASVLYGPYGSMRYSSGTMPGSYAFTGQRADATTGLDYYNARYYDPTAGQFTSADTVNDGLNRYAYVHGNPETATDPSGHLIAIGPDGGGGSGCYSEVCSSGGYPGLTPTITLPPGPPLPPTPLWWPVPTITDWPSTVTTARTTTTVKAMVTPADGGGNGGSGPVRNVVTPDEVATCHNRATHPDWCNKYFQYPNETGVEWQRRSWQDLKKIADYWTLTIESGPLQFGWGLSLTFYYIVAQGLWGTFKHGVWFSIGASLGIGLGFPVSVGFGVLLTRGSRPTADDVENFLSGLSGSDGAIVGLLGARDVWNTRGYALEYYFSLGIGIGVGLSCATIFLGGEWPCPLSSVSQL